MSFAQQIARQASKDSLVSARSSRSSHESNTPEAADRRAAEGRVGGGGGCQDLFVVRDVSKLKAHKAARPPRVAREALSQLRRRRRGSASWPNGESIEPQ